jgi:hypothetical protein
MPEFWAEVQSEGQNDAFILLAEEMVLGLGAGKRPPIKTTINGVDYRTRVLVYGGRYYLGLRKDVVAAAGARPGTEAEVSLELDTQPREVKLPSELQAALDADPAARQVFDGLAFTHRKEYVQWIEQAKREETRRARVEKTMLRLKRG